MRLSSRTQGRRASRRHGILCRFPASCRYVRWARAAQALPHGGQARAVVSNPYPAFRVGRQRFLLLLFRVAHLRRQRRLHSASTPCTWIAGRGTSRLSQVREGPHPRARAFPECRATWWYPYSNQLRALDCECFVMVEEAGIFYDFVLLKVSPVPGHFLDDELTTVRLRVVFSV